MTGIKKRDEIIIRFSNYSQKEINAHKIQTYDGKFRPEELPAKGQLFVLADGVDGHNTDPKAKEMAVRVIHESYYSAPSRDIVASLENAFKDANALVHEIFNEHADRAHLGIACTGLVLTHDRVYVTRVGDSSTYRITRQKLQNVSDLNTAARLPIIKKDTPSPARPETQLALGVQPEIELTVNEVPLRSGDCFLLCSDRLIDVGVEEIRQIVRSNTPREACEKLIDSARQMGVVEQTELQVIWVSSVQPTPDSISGNIIKLPFFTKIKMMSAAAILLFITVIFLQTIDLRRIFPSDSSEAEPNHSQNAYSNEASLLITEANAFFAAGEFDIALSRYQDLQKLGAADSLASVRIHDIFEIYKNKANLYYQKGYYSSARTFYKKALALEPESTHLASLIASCEKKSKGLSDASTKKAKSYSTSNSGDRVRGGKPSSIARATPETNERTQLWDWSTVADDEITVEKNGIRFLNSIARSRLLSQNELNQFELHLTAAVHKQSHGRHGVIVGYRAMAKSPYETFYLISLSPENEFLLLRHTNFKKEIITRVKVDSMAGESNSSFTVKCSGANLIFQYGSRLIFDWMAPEPIVGRIGLYAGPNTEVTFSNLKLTASK